MTHPIVNLREAARLLSMGDNLPTPIAVWLGTSLRTFLEDHDRDLEDVLGLRWGRGGVPWWMDEAIRARDAALRAFAARITPIGSVSAKARAVHVRAVRYGSATWPRDRALPGMPPGYAGTDREFLWRAFAAGAAMPLGERRLRQILGECETDRAAQAVL